MKEGVRKGMNDRILTANELGVSKTKIANIIGKIDRIRIS